MTDIQALLYLNGLDVGIKRKLKILELASSPSEVVGNLQKYGDEIKHILGADHYAKLVSLISGDYFNSILREMDKYDAKAISYLDDDYPAMLDNIYEKPLLLYCIGDTSLLNSKTISVVGTRNPSRYGVNVTTEFCTEFARAGLTIVSGFARGIDSAAHRAAVELDKPTIAVVANGLDITYPAENRGLRKSILDSGGLFITEYRFGIAPAAFQFPERNRIICGLSKALFVPEATEKGGTLITVNLALEQGRDLYIVPSNINSVQGKGSNKLLKDMQGCIILEPGDVLADYGLAKDKEQKAHQLTFEEDRIMDALKIEERHFEDLLEITGLNVSELNSLLMQLEMDDLIDKLSGNYYALK